MCSRDRLGQELFLLFAWLVVVHHYVDATVKRLGRSDISGFSNQLIADS